MFIGIVRLTLRIPGAQSLKDRRRVVKSLKERLRAKFSAAVAEVGSVERYQQAELGVSLVTREAYPCETLVNEVVQLAQGHKGAWLLQSQTRVLPFSGEAAAEPTALFESKLSGQGDT